MGSWKWVKIVNASENVIIGMCFSRERANSYHNQPSIANDEATKHCPNTSSRSSHSDCGSSSTNKLCSSVNVPADGTGLKGPQCDLGERALWHHSNTALYRMKKREHQCKIHQRLWDYLATLCKSTTSTRDTLWFTIPCSLSCKSLMIISGVTGKLQFCYLCFDLRPGQHWGREGSVKSPGTSTDLRWQNSANLSRFDITNTATQSKLRNYSWSVDRNILGGKNTLVLFQIINPGLHKHCSVEDHEFCGIYISIKRQAN